MIAVPSRKSTTAISLLLIIAALVFLYSNSFRYWAHAWGNDENYQSGFLMPLLFAYMVWRRRAPLTATPLKPSRLGLLVAAIGMILYVIGQAAHLETAKHLSFFIVLPGVVSACFGLKMMRRLIIPFTILIFMTPWAEPFYTDVVILVARISVRVLRLLDVPVLLESNLIHLPNLTVSVVKECTGVRYMTALVPLGIVIAYIHLRTRRRKAIMLLVAPLLAFAANTFRVVSMLFLAYKGNDILFDHTPHFIYGYGIFLIAVFVLFFFAHILGRTAPELPTQGPARIAETNAVMSKFMTPFTIPRALALVIILVLTPVLVDARLSMQPPKPLKQGLESFPVALGGWHGRSLPEEEWHPEVVGSMHNLRRSYKDNHGNTIHVYVAYLPLQTQNKELIFHANRLIPPRFRVTERGVETWHLAGNPSPSILKTKFIRISNGEQAGTLLVWYRNGSRYLYDDYVSKLADAIDSLVLNRSDGAVFVIRYGEMSGDGNREREIVSNFLEQFMLEIAHYLPQ